MPALANGTAPGPPGHFLFGHLREFRSGVLTLLLDSTRRYGDVVRFRLGPFTVHLINHPDGAEHVLQKRAQNYDKNTRSARFIRLVCGESLLTSNGASWQGQRKLLQPFFHQQSVKGFAGIMVEATKRMLAGWERATSSGDPLDAASEMMKLTYRIAAKSFFAADAGPETEAIERAMQVILPYTFGRLERAVNWPVWAPTPQNRRFREALRSIDDVVERLISQHQSDRVGPGTNSDLLGMLLSLKDGSGQRALSHQQIRDQTITFLLAGHETTSNALTWTLHLLAQHPEVQQQLHEEIDQVLQNGPPTIEQLPALKQVRQVIRESMRLYPPIWIVERRVIEEDYVLGIRLPAGTSVVVCPYTLHRHPAFWDDPEQFRPDRFSKPPPAAYLPFGAGPRYCIGSEFAMLEAQLIISLIVQKVRVAPVPGNAPEPWPGITLRTRAGLPLVVTPW
jgi:cytochrome P450